MPKSARVGVRPLTAVAYGRERIYLTSPDGKIPRARVWNHLPERLLIRQSQPPEIPYGKTTQATR